MSGTEGPRGLAGLAANRAKRDRTVFVCDGEIAHQYVENAVSEDSAHTQEDIAVHIYLCTSEAVALKAGGPSAGIIQPHHRTVCHKQAGKCVGVGDDDAARDREVVLASWCPKRAYACSSGFASGAATARISCSLNFSPPVAMNLFIARRQLALNPDFVYGRFRHHQGIQTKCATPQTLFCRDETQTCHPRDGVLGVYIFYPPLLSFPGFDVVYFLYSQTN